ncbi:MAG TPA: ABC transporter permease [Myxococcales bacterium]|nr:ABC transporter permease [Myxococcales bacterium]
MRRYLKLFWIQLRASATISLQYRFDFLVQGLMSVFWVALALVPLTIVFSEQRQSIAGWSMPEAMVVLGWFTLLKALLEGAINPSLLAVVDHIRKGTLDFVLLKPADSQFLVSTARFEPWRIADIAAALLIFGYAFWQLGRAPEVGDLVFAGLMLVAAGMVIYSLWILVVSVAFYVVRIDNLTYLITSVFDAARWPISVFSGGLRLVFTFVIPLAVMTTFPAMALLGTLDLATAGVSLVAAIIFSVLARGTWKLALARYTSASS